MIEFYRFKNFLCGIANRNENEKSILISFASWTLFVFICAGYLISQPIIVARYGHDVMSYFDYIFRFESGLRPGLGIWTAYGSFPFWIMSLAKRVLGWNTLLIPAFQIFILAIYFPILLRLNPINRFAMVLSLTLLLGLSHMGEFGSITYANFYNRTGFFLLVFLLIFAPLHESNLLGDLKKNGHTHIYFGLGLFVLLNLKVSYFVLALLYCAVFANRKQKIFTWMVVFELIYYIFVDQSLLSAFKLNQIISGVYSHHLTEKLAFLMENPTILFFYTLMPVLMYILGVKVKSALEYSSACLLILAAQLSNYMMSYEPLIIYVIAVLSQQLFNSQSNVNINRSLKLIVLSLSFFILAGFFIQIYINFNNSKQTVQDISVISKIKNFKLIRADGYSNDDYLLVINKGQKIIEDCRLRYKNCTKILVVSFEDFISRSLELNPILNQPLPFQYGYNWDEFSHPNFDFNHINFVLLRNHTDPEASDPFKKIYLDFLEQYKSCFTNEFWIMYCRR